MYDAELTQKLTTLKKMVDYFQDLGVGERKGLHELISADTWKLLREELSVGGASCNHSLEIRSYPDGWKLRYETWNVSYHNGDPYGEEEHLAVFTPAVVDSMIADLEQQYEKHELEVAIEQEERRARAELVGRARKSIRPAKERFK